MAQQPNISIVISSAQSVLLEREVSGRDAREGYESRTGRRTGKLVRRGSSYSKKERETKCESEPLAFVEN